MLFAVRHGHYRKMKFDFHNNMGPDGHGKIGKGGSINGNGLIGKDEERY